MGDAGRCWEVLRGAEECCEDAEEGRKMLGDDAGR